MDITGIFPPVSRLPGNFRSEYLFIQHLGGLSHFCFTLANVPHHTPWGGPGAELLDLKQVNAGTDG